MANNKNGFDDWWSRVLTVHDYASNPDDPMHYYDYRSAFKAGHMIPEKVGEHWESKYKHDLHPNRFVRGGDPSVDKPDVEWWDTKYDKPAKESDVILQEAMRQEFETLMGSGY